MIGPVPPLLVLAEGRRPRLRGPAKQPRGGNAEAKIQAAIVGWVRAVAPQTIVFAIPNGGLRSKSEAARMRWTGTLAGIPDLAVVAPGGRVFFVEVKTADGRLSEAQGEVIQRFIRAGVPYVVARSLDDVQTAFEQWKISTREVGR